MISSARDAAYPKDVTDLIASLSVKMTPAVANSASSPPRH